MRIPPPTHGARSSRRPLCSLPGCADPGGSDTAPGGIDMSLHLKLNGVPEARSDLRATCGHLGQENASASPRMPVPCVRRFILSVFL